MTFTRVGAMPSDSARLILPQGDEAPAGYAGSDVAAHDESEHQGDTDDGVGREPGDPVHPQGTTQGGGVVKNHPHDLTEAQGGDGQVISP